MAHLVQFVAVVFQLLHTAHPLLELFVHVPLIRKGDHLFPLLNQFLQGHLDDITAVVLADLGVGHHQALLDTIHIHLLGPDVHHTGILQTPSKTGTDALQVAVHLSETDLLQENVDERSDEAFVEVVVDDQNEVVVVDILDAHPDEEDMLEDLSKVLHALLDTFVALEVVILLLDRSLDHVVRVVPE